MSYSSQAYIPYDRLQYRDHDSFLNLTLFFQLKKDTPRDRKLKSDQLKETINAAAGHGEKRFYILLPEKNEHDLYHTRGEGTMKKECKTKVSLITFLFFMLI